MLGRVIGFYRMEERLGGGAMASVYRAIDQRSGKEVALKLLLPGADAAMRERFRREVETVRHLDFPNIVHTLEVSALGSADLAYIVMELVVGESLGQLLDRSGQLSMVDSCALLVPIARALAYAHERGVVHRDVKPSNILLRRSTWGDPNAVRIAAIDTPVVPLLSDFGIALVLDAPELTSAGRTIGTPAYMAPEQCADSREIDGRADIYALGAVLFRCLIGRSLFLGSTTQILHAHVYEPVVIPEDNMRLLSPLVVEILQLALAKQPADRYDDAAWLAEDLAVAAGHRVRSLTRRSVNGDATATMTALPATSNTTKTTTHILVPAPAPKSEPSVAERSAKAVVNRPTVDLLPDEEPVIPLIPPKKMRTPTPRTVSRTPRLLGQRSGRWIASLLTVVLTLAALSTAFVLWPRSNPPIAPTATLTIDTPLAQVATEASQPAIALEEATIQEKATVTETSRATELAAAPEIATVTETASATETVAQPVVETGAETAAPPSPTLVPTLAPTASPTNSETPVDPSPTATISDTLLPVAALVPRVTITPSLLLEPDLALQAALDAFNTGQWSTALEYLGQLRKDVPSYSPDSVAQLLGESYLMMAAVNNQSGAYTSTIQLLERGEALLAGYPVVDQLVLLSNAGEAFRRSENAAVRERSLEKLQQIHLSFAAQFVASGRPCLAVQQVAAAKFAHDDVTVRSVEATYQQQCAEATAQREQQNFLDSLGGALLYSSQLGNTVEKSNIYRHAVRTDARSTLLIADARYPVQQRVGSIISYYSTNGKSNGLYGFDLDKNFDPGERGRAIAQQFTEDGRDSPTSWNFDSDRLVFASTRETDRRSRLFLGYPTGSPTSNFLWTYATWPAWRPLRPESSADWIVYNGTNSEGNEPGLWLVTSGGSRFARLTDNGDDIAPVWTPDGNSVYFMNISRSGNWDLYHIEVGDAPRLLQPTRFASSDANEVLPAVSPDGSAVAFLSERGGRWQIWVAPINGGEAILLGDIEGKIVDPTQQSMQWVR